MTSFVKLAPAFASPLLLRAFACSALLAASSSGSARAVLDDCIRTTSPGIGIPQWIYTVWLPILSLALFLRLAQAFVELWRRGAPRA